MKRSLLSAVMCCCVLVGSTAFAADKPVEILRGPKRGPVKKSAATSEGDEQAATVKKADALKAQDQALKAREAALDAREGSLKQREEDAAKTDEASKAKAEAEKKEKAKQQKALEELGRKTQGEFGNAANALTGE